MALSSLTEERGIGSVGEHSLHGKKVRRLTAERDADADPVAALSLARLTEVGVAESEAVKDGLLEVLSGASLALATESVAERETLSCANTETAKTRVESAKMAFMVAKECRGLESVRRERGWAKTRRSWLALAMRPVGVARHQHPTVQTT